MRQLAMGLCLAVLFLGGCEWVSENVPHPDYYGTQAAQDIEDEKEDALTAERPNILERIDGPADSRVVRKFEAEFSDGTRVGCVAISNGLSCVTLKGAL